MAFNQAATRDPSPRVYPFVARPYPATVGAPQGTPPKLDAHETIIRPPARWPGLGLEELWRLRSVAIVLTRRALMVRYRETLIGAAWVIIQPLLLMSVFTLFFGVLMNRFIGSLPYPAYLFSALMAWILVARVLSQGSTSVTSNAGLLSKIYFPRSFLPISVALSGIVDFLFALLALLVMLFVFSIMPTPNVIFVPFFVLVALAAGLGASFWLSALNAKYRDVEQALPFIVQFWFFATPILYPISALPPEVQGLLAFNPITLTVQGIRWAFLGADPPAPEVWILGPIVAAIMLISGYIFFRSREAGFIDTI